MATVRRFDRGETLKAEKTPEGFLRAPAFLARTGIYLYVDASGKVTRELRRPEQVFDPASLRSFALAPVTDGHPPEGYVDATTAAKYQRGSIGDTVEQAGNMTRATMMITDAALVAKVERGDAAECSCGYTCEVLEGGGEYEGQRYDTEQVSIRGNHVAIVPAGRAGPAARVKLDAGDAVALPPESDDSGERARRDDTRTEESPMEREIVINGIKVKLPNHVCDAIEAERARQATEVQARIDAASKPAAEAAAALSAAQARADSAEAEAKKTKADADALRAAEPKRVADALEIVDVARRAGVDVKFDALDVDALKREVAEKIHGLKFDGKDPVYVSAMFDLAKSKVDDAPTGALALAALERGEGRTEREDADESASAARERMTKRNADAWKPAEKK